VKQKEEKNRVLMNNNFDLEDMCIIF